MNDREQFEAWYADWVKQDGFGAESTKGQMFMAFQAARATPAQPVPVKWPVALREAVAALYFDDSSDYQTALYAVVRNLSPEISALIESDDRADHSRAYSQVSVHYEEQPDGTITPVDPSDYAAPSPVSDVSTPSQSGVSEGQHVWLLMNSEDDALMFYTEKPGGAEANFKAGLRLVEYRLTPIAQDGQKSEGA